MSQVTAQLRVLLESWVEGTAASIERIPEICGEIVSKVLHDGLPGDLDRNLLAQVGLIAAAGQARLAECLRIQTRTGAYSTRGTFEASSRVTTSGWEG